MHLLSGFPPEKLEEYNLNFTNLPPWICTWTALYIDILCTPLKCRDTWRNYVPFGLAEEGQWFSEEFETIGIVDKMPDTLSFEEFRFGGSDGGNTTFTCTMQEQSLGKVVCNLGAQSWDDFWSSSYWNSVYEYMFHTPSTAFSCLWTTPSLWAILVLVLMLKAIKALIMPRFQLLGTRLALRTHGEAWVKKNDERIIKFGEYVFRLCYHSFISLIGFYFFWGAPWWNEDQGGTKNLWVNYPYADVSPSMSWYYLFQAAYNVDAFASLLQISFQIKLFPKNSSLPITIDWAKTVRGDFNEMLAHHIVTNALVFLSSFFRQTGVGSMVFWMHDISDVPVDMAKLANFVKWKRATELAFALLCIMWVITRLYVFPFTIWKSIHSETHELMRSGIFPSTYYYNYLPCFLILLGVLIILHLLWFTMFIKMGYMLLSRGEAHDLTEHKKGEKDHHHHHHHHHKNDTKASNTMSGNNTNGSSTSNGKSKTS